MGKFLDTLSVRTTDAAGVRAQVVGWLSAKGYDLREEAPLFALSEWSALLDDEGSGRDERGAFVVWNDKWAVVLYSHAHAEGERLLFELGRQPAPVLQTWIHDSDLWGYKLHKDGELLAEFNSDPRYFGIVEESASGRNGDAALLCATCGLGDREIEVNRVQGERALFADSLCHRFCDVLGVPPAEYEYRDLTDLGFDVPGVQTVGDFQLEHLYFVRRGQWTEPPPDLHRLTFRPAVEIDGEPAPAWTRGQLLQADILRLLFRVVFFLLWPAFFVLRLWIRWRYRHLLRGADTGLDLDPFLAALSAAKRPPVLVDGRVLTNVRHRYRLTLPEGVEAGAVIGSFVYHLTVRGVNAACEAVRPSNLGRRLQMYPGMTSEEDEPFFIGALPARRLLRRWVGPGQTRQEHVYIVQRPSAFHVFWLAGVEDLPANAPALMRELVASFTPLA